MSNEIEKLYKQACNTKSQINQHLPTILKYAKGCSHITEMGIESVISTYAMLMARPVKMVSYDVNYHPNFEVCKQAAIADGLNWEYRLENVSLIKIEPTNFLFIDTIHTENQLRLELYLHAAQVSKYIAFHDTTTFGEKAEMPGERGLRYAIEPFLQEHPEWKIVYKSVINNGLLIIERCQE